MNKSRFLKRSLAAGITLTVLAVALLVGRQQRQSAPPYGPPAADAAEDCVQRMFAAAERGDVDAYLGLAREEGA